MKDFSTRIAATMVAISLCCIPATAGATPASSEAKVYIIWPSNGQTIRGGRFWLRMGVKNAGVAPAGVNKKNTGHHHLIIDAELPPLDEEVPSNKNYRHFGGGQTEARIKLPPGKHTLQLVMGDHDHIPHNPPMYSDRITILVK